MLWRHVFDGHKQPYKSVTHAAEQALAAGYVFLSWNGEVYFIHKDVGGLFWHQTGIKTEELK